MDSLQGRCEEDLLDAYNTLLQRCRAQEATARYYRQVAVAKEEELNMWRTGVLPIGGRKA